MRGIRLICCVSRSLDKPWESDAGLKIPSNGQCVCVGGGKYWNRNVGLLEVIVKALGR